MNLNSIDSKKSGKPVSKFENPFKSYACFYAWIVWKDNPGTAYTYYSKDSNTTLKQLQAGKVTTVTLDRQLGYKRLVDFIDRSKIKIQTARIYSAFQDETVFRSFANGKWIDIADPVFTADNAFATTNEFTIANSFVVLKGIPLNNR